MPWAGEPIGHAGMLAEKSEPLIVHKSGMGGLSGPQP